VRILERKFGHTTNHMRVKRFLDQQALPVQLELDLTYFHDFDDAYRARWTVVRFWAEGWSPTSIAGALRLSRKHVHAIITAFQEDGFAGLEDQRNRPADHPANQLSLPFMEEVLELQQQHPDAGRFRIHGLLEKQYQDGERAEPPPSERTIGRAMAHNREFRDAPDPNRPNTTPSAAADDPHARRYRGQYRHHLWFIDIRYLVKLDTGWVYSLCVIEGYSRKILAGMASVHQDVLAVLQLLHAAITTYGRPDGIVSDNGSVFHAHAYQHVLQTLAIPAHYTEKGRPWQNLIEAQFGIQRRLSDAAFLHAASVDACVEAHAAFVETYNTTRHWAHRERDDGRHTPEAVLEWIRHRVIEPDAVQHAFRYLQVTRLVNQHGFVRLQRFLVYAERGLARRRVSIWVYDERLRVEYDQTLLAQYAVQYDRRRKRIAQVSDPVVYPTAYDSPQMELFELDDAQWHKIRERPYQRRSRRTVCEDATQLDFFDVA
jgi:transposase InsO family protein